MSHLYLVMILCGAAFASGAEEKMTCPDGGSGSTCSMDDDINLLQTRTKVDIHAKQIPVYQNTPAPPTYVVANNHGSPESCNLQFSEWYHSTFPYPHAAPDVLDVGGGTGGLRTQVGASSDHWQCIDVTPSTSCTQFPGDKIDLANKSKDVVVFNYVLHHAGDKTIDLLQEAARIARKYVVVTEDLKGTTMEQSDMEHEHEWTGTFRGPEEWKKIFSLLGLMLVHEMTTSTNCCNGYAVPRATYVLVPSAPNLAQSSFNSTFGKA